MTEPVPGCKNLNTATNGWDYCSYPNPEDLDSNNVADGDYVTPDKPTTTLTGNQIC